MLQTNWYTIFYWLSVVDNIKELLTAVAVIATIGTIVSIILWALATKDPNDSYAEVGYHTGKGARKAFKWSLSIGIIAGIILALTPSKSQFLMIIAGGAVGSFITSDSSSRAIPADVTKYLHTMLQKEIKELGEESRAELGIQTEDDKLIQKAKQMSKEEIIELLREKQKE